MNLLDLFSGIGGFHLGLQKAGHKIKWSGFCEIDKYASAVYRRRFPDAKELGDIKHVRERQLPKIDIITFGSPCQDFSIAGKRKGMSGQRSSLITQAIRLIDECRPSFFIWENVKGTFSSNNREDFAAILQAFTNIGSYRLEWQLLNTRWVLPQNRERIFLVGHTGTRSGREIFPIGEDGKISKKERRETLPTLTANDFKGPSKQRPSIVINTGLKQVGTIGKDSEASRVYDPKGIARTIKNGGGMGAKTGLYKVGDLKITAKKRTYDTPKEINEYLKANKKGKTIGNIAKSLDLPKTQVEHYFRSDKYRAVPSPQDWIRLKGLLGFDDTYDKQVTEIYEKEVEFESTRRVYGEQGLSPTIDTSKKGALVKVHNTQTRNPNRPSLTRVCDCGSGKLYKKCCGVDGGSGHISKDDGTTYCLDTGNTQAVEIKKINIIGNLKGEDGHECHNVHSTDGIAPTVRNNHGKITMVQPTSSIRRLTPKECERLQGFPDDWTSEGIIDGEVVKISDTQRYKQCGNAVTVDIVALVGERLL